MVVTLVCVIFEFLNSAQLYICERIWLLEEMFHLPLAPHETVDG